MLVRSIHALRASAIRAQQVMPEWLRDLLKRIYHGALLPLTYRSLARQDEAGLAAHGLSVAPPPDMRHRHHGVPDLDSYLAVGRQVFEHLQQGIALADVAVMADTKVLDFGCGSGRVLLWWAQRQPRPRLYGTDIDAAAVAWVAANLPVATNVNGFKPPLPYADGELDVVYAISVLTHLDEAAQDRWLAEVRRVLRPGGAALLTVHSDASNARLSAKDQATLAASGFLFLNNYTMAMDVFGSGYRNTYHSRGYVERHWSRYFDIVGRIEMGAQDLIVMRRPDR